MNFRIDGKWLFEDEEHLIVNQREKLSDNPFLLKIFDNLVETCPICVYGGIYFIGLEEKEKELLVLHKEILKNYDILARISTRFIKFRCSDNGHYIQLGSMFWFRVFSDYVVVKPNRSVLIIKNEYEIYSYRESKHLLIPLQLKDVTEFALNLTYKLFFLAYFKSIGTNLAKDLYNDLLECCGNLNVPIKISDLSLAYNKKMLLRNKNIETYNRFNSFPLAYSYTLMKAKKYIKENEFTRFFQIKPFFDFKTKLYEKDRVKKFLVEYFYEELGLKEEPKEYFLTDYIKMVLLLKTTVNLNINSIEQVIREHDKLVSQLHKTKLKHPKLSLSKDNPFLGVKVPKGINRIKNSKELFYEGIVNKNCVYSYLDEINRGNCMIYTTTIDNKRYTIELIKKRKTFIFNQIKGVCNSEPSAAVVDTIYDDFIEVNSDVKFKLAL